MRNLKEGNRKVKNTKLSEYDGLNFRSRLEMICYKKLKENGFNPEYESEKIILWNGKYLDKVSIFVPDDRLKGSLKRESPKLRDITYTPDIIVDLDVYKIYIEVKGFANDTYPIKRKMFLKYLDSLNDGIIYLFYEPHSVQHVSQMISQLKELWTNLQKK